MTELKRDAEGRPDFSLPDQPKPFRVDDDIFVAPARLGPATFMQMAEIMPKLAGARAGGNDAEAIRTLLPVFGEVFTAILGPDEGTRFEARLNSPTLPIDLFKQAMPILFWLLEEYGLRPTVPSSGSPTGSTATGEDSPSGDTSSTDGALLEASGLTISDSPTG